VRAEDRDGLAGLDEQRLVILNLLELAHDRLERAPVARGLAPPAIDDEVAGALRHLGVEVVHQATERRFLMPALAVEFRAARRAYALSLTQCAFTPLKKTKSPKKNLPQRHRERRSPQR
jgi:hypothetical protein